jgi:putative membrane protein
MIHGSLSLLLFADTWGMHDSDVGTGWMIVMMLGMVVFWGLVIFGIVWLLRGSLGHGNHDPVAILDRRLADGQISVKEYEQRRKALGSRPASSAL